MTEDRRGAQALPPVEYSDANAKKQDPDPGHFEIGLVLAGAVSAGAYIAGALDFLIEAMDSWEDAKARDRDNGTTTVPNHSVDLKVVTGASGGGMNGAIAAATLGRSFPHIRLADVPSDGAAVTENPFFDAWVQQIDISKLLGGQDMIEGQAPPSLLDSSKLWEIVTSTLTWPSGSQQRQRPWVCDPLRVFLTVTNLRGVPYGLRFGGESTGGYGNYMMLHRDHVRFALNGVGDATAEAPFADETLLSSPVSVNAPEWRRLGVAALASGAFPGFLQARTLEGLRSDYAYRVVAWEQDRSSFESVPPSWDSLETAETNGDDYRFLNVDGGAMDNEPLELARIVLAGARGRNERAGDKANRATLLIDPFVDAPHGGPASGDDRNPLSDLSSLFGAYKSQARFRPEDLALASNPETYSRFVIAPSRSGHGAPHPLAAGAFGGFGGFLARDFRVHDYLLGRRNAQRFLSRYFTLPARNPLFAGWTQDSALRERYLTLSPSADGESVSPDHLPIIRLIDGSPGRNQPEPLPSWPRGGVNIQAIATQVEARGAHLYPYVEDMLPLNGVAGWLFKTFAAEKLRQGLMTKLRQTAVEKLRRELAAFNLL